MYTAEVTDLEGIGPTVDCVLSFTSAAQDTLTAAGKPVPPPVQASLQIDTGASMSHIRYALIERFKPELQLTGIAQVGTALSDATERCPVYDLKVEIPNAGVVEARFAASRTTTFEDAGIDGVIGRNILRHGWLMYIGSANRFMLSF